MVKYCWICYSTKTDDDFICDICDRHYCEDCSYSFTLHYQFQGSRCYSCANQSRRKKYSIIDERNNKIDLILDTKCFHNQ